MNQLQSPGRVYILTRMLSTHYTFSKRALGWLLVLVGGGGFLAILAIDVLNAGRAGGIGPAQQIALGATALLVLVGLTLIPLGDRPA